MKRKRPSKKGKGKKQKFDETNDVASNVSLNTEDNSGLDESDTMIDSGTDGEPKPSPSGMKGQPERPANSDFIGRQVNNFGEAVYTRVKVKIKNSKNLESMHTSSDSPLLSNAEKSSQQLCLEKQVVHSEKMEDCSNSLSETNGGLSGNASRKSVGIKIKSSRGFGCSTMSPCSNTETSRVDKTEIGTELLHRDPKNNEQDLKAALEVIRKVMKMDAAEPFNVPVNPVALGIPDYFDVIDTPMDFGTICSNLEKGVKYLNAEDVLRDVQYIWDNCYKYNNKGDYIVELMKRVKKNYMKYWAAVGLFSDQPQETNGIESMPVMEITPSNQGTPPADSSSFNLPGKKIHGLKKHKEGCQCAICVMMRRRQEREEIVRMMGGDTEGSDDSMGEEPKQEGASRGQSPSGEYNTSTMENFSDADADSERKGQDMKLGHIRNFYGQHKGNHISIPGNGLSSVDLQLGQRPGDECIRHYQTPNIDSGGGILIDTQGEMLVQNEEGNAALDQQKPKEVLGKNQRAKMLENLRYLENPMLLELCGTLFSDSSESFWCGPRSLVGRKNSTRQSSSFHSAISSFME